MGEDKEEEVSGEAAEEAEEDDAIKVEALKSALEVLRHKHASTESRLESYKLREREVSEQLKTAQAELDDKSAKFRKMEELYNWASIMKNKKQRENDALTLEKQRLEAKIKMAQTLQTRAEEMLKEEQKEVQRERSQRLIDLHKHQKLVEVHAALDREVEQLRQADGSRLEVQLAHESEVKALKEEASRLRRVVAARTGDLSMQKEEIQVLTEQVDLLRQRLRESRKDQNSKTAEHLELRKAFGRLQQAYSRLARTASEKTAAVSKTAVNLPERRLLSDFHGAKGEVDDCKHAVCPVFQERHLFSDGAEYAPPINAFREVVEKTKADMYPQENTERASKPLKNNLGGGLEKRDKTLVILNKAPAAGSGYVGKGLGLKKSSAAQPVGALLAGSPTIILKRLQKLKGQ